MRHKNLKKLLLMTFLSLGFIPIGTAADHIHSLGAIRSISQKDSGFVIVNAGRKQGLEKDMILITSRKLVKDKGISIPTGRIQITELSDDHAVAKNLMVTTELAKAFFPKHPGLMMGDEIKIEAQELNDHLVATPVLRIPYSEIFRDPGKTPQSYSLSEQGRQLLAKAAQQIYALKPGQIVIEAFTDALGDAQDNLFETTQRSEVVRQFFLESQPFHAEQVVSLGFGEEESDLENFSKVSMQKQRYLLIRATRLY